MSAYKRLTPEETTQLVARAGTGDQSAWEELVDAYAGVIWSVARGFRLRDSDAHDVVQTTWLRLLEHLNRLNDPSRVGAWLATTARRECLRIVALSARTSLSSADQYVLDGIDNGIADSDAALISCEEAGEVHRALDLLPERWRLLLVALMDDPSPTYEEVSARLEIPIGSIGPTRGRALRQLHELLGPDVSLAHLNAS